jgi:hypothetical protein
VKGEPVVTVTDASDPRVEAVGYLPDALRGDGLGRRILKLAEDEGRRRGWRVFGEIPCEPPGTRRIFMTKTL